MLNGQWHQRGREAGLGQGVMAGVWRATITGILDGVYLVEIHAQAAGVAKKCVGAVETPATPGVNSRPTAQVLGIDTDFASHVHRLDTDYAVHDTVLVAFEWGDPDRPILLGRMAG